MAEIAYCALITAISWHFALSYICLPAGKVRGFTILTAAGGGILWYLIKSALPKPVVVLLYLLFFMAIAALICLLIKRTFGDAVIALLMAFGSYAMLCWLGEAWLYALGTEGLGAACLLAIGQLAATLLLKEKFPEASWRDHFATQTRELREQLQVKLQYAYWGPAVLFLVFAACWLWVPLTSLVGTIVLTGLSQAAFWGIIAFLIFMHTYQREHAVLFAEQQYREDVQSFLTVIRSQRHDYNFHVQTLAGLIRAGDLAECQRYMDTLEQDSAAMNAVLPVKDPAIAAMLHNFQLLAARENITLHMDIKNDLSQVATNVYETNKIISNLLQNALDETRKHADRSYGIWLTILKRNEYCVIRVSNALDTQLSAEQINRIFQPGYSTKQGHEGVGLNSVRLLVNRYRGMLETKLEENIIHFVVRLPLTYAKEPFAEEDYYA